jgi:hypothetical protein
MEAIHLGSHMISLVLADVAENCFDNPLRAVGTQFSVLIHLPEYSGGQYKSQSKLQPKTHNRLFKEEMRVVPQALGKVAFTPRAGVGAGRDRFVLLNNLARAWVLHEA